VPVTGHAADDEMLAIIGSCFPDRKVVGVPGDIIAFGGGGPHCATQQIPVFPGAL
jgi:agmatine deiminase